ncbi:TetR family transcriptional regulator C-terminal domain-containing protein [Pseudomonas aeruginosa]|nr:TetR/AcrR family transcriptional regulator [uncultured Pseudomonas sp.]EKQ6358002.1 TetR family transcriptional regulator C-terminal domain-containing protein [Pseudomonas aeruginosa]MCT1015636.1 TetR/AcrR family transcriptional regulator [Pseudomonas aeruginosa]HCF3636077.1 TetR family transcriptional regulator C-terminal domain-containing protein [Pseudomonas aeruginosa]HCF3683685.1 TetR family transcriptional regulator C-terminal domain-containing protein [Pseudomonas aeruginosa]HEJ44422
MARHNVREQLIDAGLQTLQLSGFNGCAVQDITQTAGVPKGSFYNHFESKEALALLVLERFWESGAERRALLSDAAVDPVERLRKHFKALSDAVILQEFRKGCLIGNFSSEMAKNEEIRGRLASIYTMWSRTLATCIDDAKAAGKVRPDLSADAIADFLVSSWEGTVLRAKVEQTRYALDQFEHVVFASFFT